MRRRQWRVWDKHQEKMFYARGLDFNYKSKTVEIYLINNKDNLGSYLTRFEEIELMARYLLRDEKWVLQPFRPTKCMLSEEASNIIPYTETELKDLHFVASHYSDNVSLRHV